MLVAKDLSVLSLTTRTRCTCNPKPCKIAGYRPFFRARQGITLETWRVSGGAGRVQG